MCILPLLHNKYTPAFPMYKLLLCVPTQGYKYAVAYGYDC